MIERGSDFNFENFIDCISPLRELEAKGLGILLDGGCKAVTSSAPQPFSLQPCQNPTHL